MDISETLAPDSAQLDAVELLGGPQTFTITKVDVKLNAEQPVSVHLDGFPRPWKPGKSMRRVLAACLGTDSSAWIGHRVTLFCDERVRFGNDVVGGTRIKAITGIKSAKKIPLLASRGKSVVYIVEPLPDAPAAPEWTEAEARVDALRAEWETADAERRAAIEAEVAELKGGAA